MAKFVSDVDFEEFQENLEKNRACILTLEQIGETAKKLSKDFKNEHSNMAWGDIIGMRNRIAHDYEGIYLDVVWDTITEDVPKLKAFADRILENT